MVIKYSTVFQEIFLHIRRTRENDELTYWLISWDKASRFSRWTLHQRNRRKEQLGLCSNRVWHRWNRLQYCDACFLQMLSEKNRAFSQTFYLYKYLPKIHAIKTLVLGSHCKFSSRQITLTLVKHVSLLKQTSARLTSLQKCKTSTEAAKTS